MKTQRKTQDITWYKQLISIWQYNIFRKKGTNILESRKTSLDDIKQWRAEVRELPIIHKIRKQMQSSIQIGHCFTSKRVSTLNILVFNVFKRVMAVQKRIASGV